MDLFSFIQNIDFQILDFIQATIKCAFLDPIMRVFSYLGEYGTIWILTAIILLFFKKTRRLSLTMLVAMALGFVVGELGIKNIVCRERPFILNPDIVLNISPPSGFSCPSGHSCSSFAAATVIFCWDKRYGIGAYVIAAAIAFSRLYNYVHFPSDVLCGILLGIVCALFTVMLFKKITHKSNHNLRGR